MVLSRDPKTNDRAVTAVFQTLPGAAFVVNGAGDNPDGALVSAGAEMNG